MGNRGILSYLLCFLFLLRSSSVYSQTQPCNPNDLNSLRVFLTGLNATIPGWSFSTSDCCYWRGVSCGVGRRVIGLDLFNMSLKGSISESLSGLDQLRRINFSGNSLHGLVPRQIFHLQKLEQLDLSANELSGSIPLDANIPSIQFLNISRNLFNGSHPILAGSKNLSTFDVSFNEFAGSINTSICNDWAAIQILQFSMNFFSGEFPVGFGNCSLLTELSLDVNEISGNLPEDLFKLSSLTRFSIQQNRVSGRLDAAISNLSNLAQLDISVNDFSGTIPNVLNNLKRLESFSAQSNRFQGPLPSSLSNLSTLKVLNLRNNSLSGKISLNFTAMTQLSYLDLGSNLFTGTIPSDLSQCSKLKLLNLANNSLAGEIPDSFKSLVSLSDLSLSKNCLSNISSALGILQHCPSLTNLVLTRNFLGGERMPVNGIQGFTNVEVLVIPNCGLSGFVPTWLINSTKLKVLDLSWNQLEGSIPSWIGNLEHLFYLDLSNNSLAGEIPISLTQMKGLISSDNSSQHTSIQNFPFFIRRNITAKGLQYKQVSSFPPSLMLCSNMLVGSILPGFGDLKMLHVLALDNNRLSGNIPEELSNMSSLETLNLAHNNLTGSIPESLVKLNFLSSFDVSYNDLVGPIPSGGQFSTFTTADFDGNPGLCNSSSSSSSSCTAKNSIQSVKKRRNKGIIVAMTFGIGLGTAILLAIVYLIVSRPHSRIQEDTAKEEASANGYLETAGSTLVLLFQNKDNTEITIGDIMKSTGNFSQENIIGCGGFGLVYKATLSDGRKVAIKRLSGDYGQMEREFHAEVEALSRAQHENLVLLQGYCKIGNDRLLIYSYMENGSLDYWLHEKFEEGSALDWETRLRIAQGSARGLAYLHQSCQPHILHRDIKSSNILLDENFEAHLADFGLARLVLPYDTHVTTDLVGTLGYIPPEYGQSSVATFKGDVYSFGVVLLELLTGKRPVDMSKPKGSRDLISWVIQMKNDKREAEVFDPFIYDKENDGQMIKMLDIACLCLSNSPKLRPLTHQLVTWLDNIGLAGQLIK
ncbi:uncharacterized protein A4U43_C04F4630 [Asparagus officinalis]|uniref:non-specific serine/threonine protein kinase n=1 Tax=Asparagus officinalis TaxID=4686 RepID=A0A5P1F382_ASPOF|nr:phytosulfokine receptor 1-like [Asparagus officinalis]ONK71091.1 uncharacterized protein A4U43_C04F4630 [Asparagus officinalis]